MKTKRLFISTLIAAAAMGLTAYANEAATQTTPVIAETDAPEGADKLLPLADAPAAEEADAPAEETQDADALELLLADDALVELDEAAAPDELSTETMMREWIARYAAAARFAGIRSVKGTGGGLSSGGAVATAGADFAVSAAAPTPSVSVPAAGTVSLADTLTRASAADVSLGSASASDAGTASVATASSAAGTSTILPAAFFSTRSVFSVVPAATASYSLAGSSGVSAYAAGDDTSAEDSRTTIQSTWPSNFIDSSTGRPTAPIPDFGTATLNASSTLTLSGNTIVTIRGNPGSAINIDTAGHLLAVVASGDEVQFSGKFTGDGAVWFKQGRFQARNTNFFDDIGDVHVSEGSQLQLSAATMNITNNFFLGSVTGVDGTAALRVGVWNGSNLKVDAVLSGVTTVLAQGTKIGFQYGSTLDIQQLTGSGNIDTANHASGGILKISGVTGDTGYTGKIDLVSGVTLNWSSSTATFGGLSGTAGTVAGGSYLNIKDAKAGSTFAGSVGAAGNGVALTLSSSGTQAFTGTNYFKSVSVNGGTLSLGGTTTVSGATIVTGGALVLTGTTTFTGELSVSGATLDVSSGTHTFGNAFTLNGGNVVLGNAYFLGDTAHLSASTITATSGTVEFSGAIKNGTYTIFTGTDSASLVESGISLTGTLNSGYTQTWTKDGNDITVTISGAARDLIWSGATNTTWDTESANWKTSAEATESTRFNTYDYVTFNGDATVTVASDGVTAGPVTVSSGTLVLSGGRVTANMLVGSGTIQLDSLTGLSVGTANDANRFAAWTGTVAFKNISGVSGVGLDLRNYGNENSKIVFDGVSGTGTGSNQGLWFVEGTFASDIEIGENGLKLTNGSGNWTTTFSGALSGTGTFYHNHTTTQIYKFTGNVSEFTGTLKSTTATFKFAGTENQTFSGAIIGDDTTGAKVAKEGSTTLTLNNANTKIADLRISAGTLNLNAGEATFAVATNSLSGGTLNIGSDATVKVAVSDAVNWNGTTSIDVAGVLALNDGVRISLGANNSLSLSGGRISGAGDAHGALDFFGGAHTIRVTEDSEIAAAIRPRNNSLKFNVNDQKTLTVSGAVSYSNGQSDRGTIEKLGAGILDFTNTVAVDSITQSAGTLTIGGAATITTLTQSAGTLNINGAATKNITTATISNNTTAMNISGTATFDSLTQNAGTLTIGGATTVTGNYTGSSGTDKYSALTVNAGASLSVGGDFTLRYLNNNTANTGATMDVSGDVSVGGNFWIARDGKGIVNINDGGTVVANTLTFGQAWTGDTTKSSTVNLESGGVLIAGQILASTSTEGDTPSLNVSALNLKGGILGTSEDSLAINVTSGSGSAAKTLSVVLGTGTTSTINTGKYNTSTKTFTNTGAAISIANVISGDGALKKTGAGMLTLTGDNIYRGGTTLSEGTLVAGSANALGSGPVTAAGSTSVNEVTLKVGETDAAAALTLANDISISAGKTLILESTNVGNKLTGTISGANGALKLASGTLEIAGTTTLKNATVSNGAVLKFNGATTTVSDKSEGIHVDGGGSLVFSSGTATVGRIILNTWYSDDPTTASASAEVTGGVVNVTSDSQDGAISIGSGASWQSHRLTVSGGVLNATAGTMTLGYSSAGTLELTGGEANLKGIAFGKSSASGTLKVSNARLNLGESGIEKKAGAGTGSVSFGEGATIGALDSWSSAANVGISLAGTVTFDTTKQVVRADGTSANADGNIGSSIELSGGLSGDGALKKTGVGMLTLSGANTYTGGTTIEQGTLVAGSASALGKGKVTVGADGKLGIAAGVTITEVSGGIELANGAKIVVDLSDQLSKTETFEVTLATHTAISLAAKAALAYSEGGAMNLTDYLDELKGWNKLGWTSSLTYADNTLKLTMAIPEPSLFGLLAGVTALGFSMSSRRRRKKA